MDPQALCLALNMFFEARGEGPNGMAMVADVTLARVEDRRYPDTVCDVVYQRKQFSWTHDGASEKPDTSKPEDKEAWAIAKIIANAALDHPAILPGSGATHYHTKDIHPGWASSLSLVGAVGEHVFYAWK